MSETHAPSPPIAGSMPTVPVSRLEHFPISFFAVVMGLNGWVIALQRAQGFLGFPLPIGNYLLVLSAIVFIGIAILYGLKTVRYPQAVHAELHHPIKMSFFPTISISLLLFSIALLGVSQPWSFAVWAGGTALHFAFTLYIMSLWIHHSTFDIKHSNPAWFIPVVGNIIIPIAGVEHGMGELSWFFFSIGIVFWILLFTIFFYRVIFHPPMLDRLMPTLFILLAPPAVGFVSYMKLMEQGSEAFTLDPFARILYYLALFIFTLLLVQVRIFARLHFYLSWWAYSFPIAALTIASMLMYRESGVLFFSWLSSGLLVLLSLVIAGLAWQTIAAMRQHAICVEE